jgi:hypothetical protein
MGDTRASNPTFDTLRPKASGPAGGRETFDGGYAAPAPKNAPEKYETFSGSSTPPSEGFSGKTENASVTPRDVSLTAANADGRVTTERQGKSVPDFRENWLARNGHLFTFTGIFLFTLVLYFRPYELVPALAGFKSMALMIALGTLLIYIPTQFTVEGNLTALPVEVKCILFIIAWALITMPIARNPALAWATFTETFIKVTLMFIVMVNTLRTERRIKALMWLGIGVGVMLSWQAIELYQRGEFKTEGYRVSVDFGGMFGNPNDMSIHLVMFVPIAVALCAASGNWIARLLFFAAAAVMTAGSFVTQSRGAFLGLIAVAAVLVWKLGRSARFKAMLIAGTVGLVVIALAPGNYGLRILSIFIPALDPVGSSGQRTELLIRSVVVSLRNPLGIGIGNFEMVGVHNLGTHNAYTQVSAELGLLAFVAYIVFLLWPVRRLDLMEKQLFTAGDRSWIYYLSIGIQASIAGYMVSSFFSSVAYQWYVYYPVAYAIGLRRIYQLGLEKTGEDRERRPTGRIQEVQHA